LRKLCFIEKTFDYKESPSIQNVLCDGEGASTLRKLRIIECLTKTWMNILSLSRNPPMFLPGTRDCVDPAALDAPLSALPRVHAPWAFGGARFDLQSSPRFLFADMFSNQWAMMVKTGLKFHIVLG